MVQQNIIGIAMELDVTDLKAGLAETRKAITTANKEFKASTAGMDDWKNSTEGLQAKLKQLDTVLTMQKKNLAGYEAELERVAKEKGENSEEARRLRDKILDAQAAIGKTEKELRNYSKRLDDVESESKDTDRATDDMSDAMKNAKGATVDLKGGFTVLKGAMANLVSTGIQSIISGIQNIVTESREFRTEMSYLQSTADDTGASFDQAKDKVKEVYAVLGETDSAVEGMNNLMTAGFNGDSLDKITDQLVGASIKWHDTLKFEGLADGLQETLATGAAVGPFAELLERAGMNLEDFDEGLSKCKTDAEKQNYVLQKLNKLGLADITKGYRESNKELVEGAEAQFEYEEASAAVGAKVEPVMTTIKQGWVDVLGAVLDTSDGVGTAGIQDAIKGAFTWFIDECIPAIKDAVKFVIDHQDIILSLIVGIGSAFAAWKVVSIIQGVITATKLWWTTTEGLTLAQKLLNTVMSMNPIGLVIGAIVGLIAVFVLLWNKCDWFREFWINLWDNIVEWCGQAWEAIKQFFSAAWEWIQQAWAGTVEWFQNLWSGIKNVWSDVTTWFGNLFTSAKNMVQSAWSTVTTFFSNIWSGIKNVFASVGAWFSNQFTNAKNMIQSAWSSVTAFFSNIWKGIKNTFANVSKWFGEKFRTAKNAVQSAWNNVVSFFRKIWNGIKSAFSNVASTLGGFFRSAWSNIRSAWSGVTGWFGKIVDKIVGFFKDIPDKMLGIGKDMMNGLIDGVKSMTKKVKKAVEKAVDSAVKGVKDFLGIESPSKLMRDEVGKMMGAGVGEGILASTNTVLRDAKSFADRISVGLSPDLNTITAGLNDTTKGISGVNTTTVTNNFTQVINAPKTPRRIELYRQSKNLLSMKGAY